MLRLPVTNAHCRRYGRYLTFDATRAIIHLLEVKDAFPARPKLAALQLNNPGGLGGPPFWNLLRAETRW